MPTAAKAADNMTKHLTRTEREAREQAEEGVLPDRGRKPELKKPAIVRSNKRANAYWNQILKQMEGLVLLDDLDATVLAGYCSMLARRDQTTLLIAQLTDRLGVQDAVDDGARRRKKDADLSDREWEASAKGAQVLSPDELVEAAVTRTRLPVDTQAAIPVSMKNRQVVAILYRQGIFNIKNAVDLVAAAMGISKNTVYLHLRHIKEELAQLD